VLPVVAAHANAMAPVEVCDIGTAGSSKADPGAEPPHAMPKAASQTPKISLERYGKAL